MGKAEFYQSTSLPSGSIIVLIWEPQPVMQNGNSQTHPASSLLPLIGRKPDLHIHITVNNHTQNYLESSYVFGNKAKEREEIAQQ